MRVLFEDVCPYPLFANSSHVADDFDIFQSPIPVFSALRMLLGKKKTRFRKSKDFSNNLRKCSCKSMEFHPKKGENKHAEEGGRGSRRPSCLQLGEQGEQKCPFKMQ